MALQYTPEELESLEEENEDLKSLSATLSAEEKDLRAELNELMRNPCDSDLDMYSLLNSN